MKKTWILSTADETEGMLIQAESHDEARKLAKHHWKWTAFVRNFKPATAQFPFCCAQVMEHGKNAHFDTRKFTITTHFHGKSGTGCATDYDATIYQPLSERVEKFIGESDIQFKHFRKPQQP